MIARRRVSVLVVLSVAAALALAGFAATRGASQPSIPPSATVSLPPQVHRNVDWYGVPQTAPRTVHIDSSAVNTTSPDEFQITYSGGNFTLVYQKVAGGPITNQYTLSLQGLVEWNDTAGDGQYENGVPVVAYTPLGPGGFGRFSIVHSEATTADGVHEFMFGIASNKGEVSVNLTIADGFVALPTGQVLTPMEAKLTLNIAHNLTVPGSRLSLQLGITTDQNVSLANQSWDDLNDFSTDDRAVNMTNAAGLSSAYFAWSNSASVNGVVGKVVPSDLINNETTGGHDLYLSYPVSTSTHVQIVHDPEIGVESAAYLHPIPGSPLPFVGDAILYAASLVAIAAVVAGTAILVRRRRRKNA